MKIRGIDPDATDDHVTAAEWLQAHRAEQAKPTSTARSATNTTSPTQPTLRRGGPQPPRPRSDAMKERDLRSS